MSEAQSIQQEGLEEAAESAADEASSKRKQQAKPLNSNERRALGKLVDGDFDSLKLEMTQMADDIKRHRQAEIEEKYKDKEALVHSLRDSVESLKKDFYRELKEIKRHAQEEGVDVTDGRDAFMYFDVQFHIRGLQDEINRMTIDVNRDLTRAINTLERKRIETQRKVLLTGIVSDDAMDVLNSLPDAKALMLEAAQSDVTRLALTG